MNLDRRIKFKNVFNIWYDLIWNQKNTVSKTLTKLQGLQITRNLFKTRANINFNALSYTVLTILLFLILQ